MQRIARLGARFAAALAIVLPTALVADQITVFAASSLRDVLGDIAADYERDSDDTVVLVFAASSAIARQVAQGAPADVVITADATWGAWLVEQGAVDAVVPIASNRLVMVGRTPEIVEFPDFIDDSLIAMAQVEAVPAGRYGKAALEALGLWNAFEGQVVQAANVRAALRFVERGEVDFGIGYGSDLIALPDLVELHEFGADLHPVILYSSAYLTEGGYEFMYHIQSVAGQSLFQKWGFLPRPEPS